MNRWKVATFGSLAVAAFFALRPLASADHGPAGAARHGAAAAPDRGPSFPLSSFFVSAPSTENLEDARDADLGRAASSNAVCEAARALGELRTDRAADLLSTALAARKSTDMRTCIVEAVDTVHTEHAHELLRAVLKDADPTVRTSAIAVLAKSPYGAPREDVRELGRKGPIGDRVEATLALAEAADPSALDLVTPLLGSMPNDRVVRLLDALRKAADPSSDALVSSFLDHPAPTVRNAALAAMGATGGEEARAKLTGMLDGADGDNAADALTDTPEGRTALLGAARGGSPRAQRVAMQALANTEGPEVEALMMEHLTDADPQLARASAAYAMAHRLTQAVPILTAKAAESPEAASTVAQLATHMGAEGVTVLGNMVQKGQNAEHALATLATMPEGRDKARELAIELVKKRASNTAANLLAEDPSPEASRALLDMARSRGSSAAVALRALSNRRDPESLRVLAELSRGEGSVKYEALSALAERGDKEADALLAGFAKSDHAKTRATALGALASRGDASAFQAAITDADPSVRTAALGAADEVARPMATTALEQLAKDTNRGVAMRAKMQLARMAPERAVALAKQDLADPKLRANALNTLRNVPFAQKREVLAAALRDNDTAQSAIQQLVSEEDDDATNLVAQTLSSSSEETRKAAADALYRQDGAYRRAHESQLRAILGSDTPSDDDSDD